VITTWTLRRAKPERCDADDRAIKVEWERRQWDLISVARIDSVVVMSFVTGRLRGHIDAQTRGKDDANCLHRIRTFIRLC